LTLGMRFVLAMISVAMCGSAATASAEPALTKVAAFKHQVTGVAVSPDGRVFVNFPRWSEDAPISVAEVKNGVPVAFPSTEWNAWRNSKPLSAADHWICVQSVVIGPHGNLWVVDPAAPAMGATIKGGPKLVEIDLKTNQPARTISFPDTVALQASYLNDVRFSPDGKTAYLTDSGARGAIIVVDLTTGNAKRVLDGDPSTQLDPAVTVTADGKPLRRPDGRGLDAQSDGIALSLDGKTLYWQALRGKTLYRAATSALIAGTAKPEIVGDNGPADGLWIARDGRMYVTSPEDNAIKVRDLGATSVTTVVKDVRLRWPDSFAEAADGTLYVTGSHIQDSALFKPGAPIALPTELWSFKPAVRVGALRVGPHGAAARRVVAPHRQARAARTSPRM
jgi:sugar lactone lactonase YvrE